MALKEDITHKKHLEEAMVQSEKMASIGLLAAGVAHEINNPLGFIDSNLNTLSGYLKQFSKYIQETGKLINTDLTQKLPAAGPFIERFNQLGVDYELDFLVKDFKEAMEESLDGARRIKKIISTMKDFARAEKPVFQPADINDILEKSLDLVWNELKYKAEVVKEYDEVPLIECESDRLCQVFINLLINAAQAIEDKGVIRIKIFKNENSVVVKISDNGKGIPSVDLGKIFEVFYSTKEKDKGTGLGLSVSRKIIQDHNGTIEVDSCLGKGTTFTIMLPFKAGEKVAKYRVLIFDDDEGVRDILKVAVSEIRPLSAIRTAKDGFEVGNLLSAFKPDLVLLDIFMPGLNGFDVCQKIKSDPRYGAIKIIMISGVDERELAEKAAAAGADTFLAKPISMNALQQAISSFTDPAASRPQKGSGNNVRHS